MSLTKSLRIRLGIDVKEAGTGIRSLSGMLRLVGSSLRAVFRTGVVAGFFALFRAGTQTLGNLRQKVMTLGAEFAQLRIKAAEAAAIISKGGTGFDKAFQDSINLSRQLSTQTQFTAQQIQEGLITAARSGLDLQDSFSVTSSALQLATVHGEQFQDTLNNLISTQRAFGVELESIPAFADALTSAVTSSNVSLDGLFAGLKNVASIASTAFGESKQTIVDTTAALMVLNDAGIQAEKGGTRLRAAFQKLLGGTAQTTAAFTKYGVNIFQADGASQEYLGTLLNAQKAMAKTEDELNKLKNRQFELILANKEGSVEFQKNQEVLDATNSKLNNLGQGLNRVYDQFTLAGGKLKPFSAILKEMSKSVPAEVIGRAFGIRGGEAIMRLMKDAEKFERFRKIVSESMELSEQGTSMTDNMYLKFLDTIMISWQRIKNTALGIWGIIADGLFEAFKTVLPQVQESLSSLFDTISKNKDAFKIIFTAALQPLQHIFSMLTIFTETWAKAFDQALDPAVKTMNVPTMDFDRKTGEMVFGEKEITGDIFEKTRGAVAELGNSFVAVVKAGIYELEPLFKWLAGIFSDGLAAQLKAQGALWTDIGTQIAGAMVRAFGSAIADIIPNALTGALNKAGIPQERHGAVTGAVGATAGIMAKGPVAGPMALAESLLNFGMNKFFGGNTKAPATPVTPPPSETGEMQSRIGSALEYAKMKDTEVAGAVENLSRHFVNGHEVNITELRKTGQLIDKQGNAIIATFDQVKHLLSETTEAVLRQAIEIRSLQRNFITIGGTTYGL